MTDKVDILLSRYFSGEATESELQQLDNWLAESEENEAYFDRMTALYQQTALMPSMPELDVTKALSDFNKYMNNNGESVKKRRFRISPVFRIAAASVVLLLGIFTFYMLYEPVKVVNLVAENSAEEYSLFEDASVVLEPNSKIRYFSDKENELELSGKATFTVEPKQERKLLVQAGATFIKDIGTVFTVTAHNPHDPVMVEVFEGEVQFYTGENEGIIVSMNETAIYDPATKQFTFITMEETLDEITFVATPLREVAEILSSRYGVNIRIWSRSLENMQISVSFDKYESIEIILEIVAETLGLNISKDANGFVIR